MSIRPSLPQTPPLPPLPPSNLPPSPYPLTLSVHKKLRFVVAFAKRWSSWGGEAKLRILEPAPSFRGSPRDANQVGAMTQNQPPGGGAAPQQSGGAGPVPTTPAQQPVNVTTGQQQQNDPFGNAALQQAFAATAQQSSAQSSEVMQTQQSFVCGAEGQPTGYLPAQVRTGGAGPSRTAPYGNGSNPPVQQPQHSNFAPNVTTAPCGAGQQQQNDPFGNAALQPSFALTAQQSSAQSSAVLQAQHVGGAEGQPTGYLPPAHLSHAGGAGSSRTAPLDAARISVLQKRVRERDAAEEEDHPRKYGKRTDPPVHQQHNTHFTSNANVTAAPCAGQQHSSFGNATPQRSTTASSVGPNSFVPPGSATAGSNLAGLLLTTQGQASVFHAGAIVAHGHQDLRGGPPGGTHGRGGAFAVQSVESYSTLFFLRCFGDDSMTGDCRGMSTALLCKKMYHECQLLYGIFLVEIRLCVLLPPSLFYPAPTPSSTHPSLHHPSISPSTPPPPPHKSFMYKS